MRPPKTEEKPKNIMNRVIIVQLLLSLLVTGLLYGVCRTDSALAQNIRSFYAQLSANDMSASEVLGTFKKVAKFTFLPSAQQKNEFSADEDETTENAGETAEATGEKAVFSPVYLTVNFTKPIESENVTSHFGYRISPITNKYSFHSGIDIAAEEGAKISAAYDGIVEKAEYNSINGNFVVIKHSDTLKTTYNHCSRLFVKEGMKLKKGEKIALAGSTGASTGSHLHFEIILNGKYINPLRAI